MPFRASGTGRHPRSDSRYGRWTHGTQNPHLVTSPLRLPADSSATCPLGSLSDRLQFRPLPLPVSRTVTGTESIYSSGSNQNKGCDLGYLGPRFRPFFGRGL
jgi:hypothetical protein